jgi:predicted porin
VIDRETKAATGVIKSDLYYLGVSYPASALVTVDGQVAYRDIKNSGNDVSLLAVRATYAMSKRTAVYAAVGRMKNDGLSAVALDAGGTVGVGKTQNGLMAGMRHSF